MGFRITRNVDAQVVQGTLSRHEGTLATSIERLSTGLRINKSADDSANLSISQKFQSQVMGLNRAINNAQDGISLLQTAQGSLSENSSMLVRLRELSVQSQSDALTTKDRIEIQSEVDQLIQEIDRISSSTEYNQRNLLDGSASTRVSTNSTTAHAYQTGETVEPGLYDVVVQRTAAGEKQQQTSNIFRTLDGELATADTQLRDLEVMYDEEGIFLLENPQTLSVRGAGNEASVSLNATTTLDELAREMELTIRDRVDEGGIDLGGSSFDFQSDTGQFLYVAGLEGPDGGVTFSGDDKIIDAIGMSVIRESEDAGYLVTAVEQGVVNPETFKGTTTTTRATGIIEGLDFEFELDSEAKIDGTVEAIDSIQIGAVDVVFTMHDTNAEFNGQAAGFISAGVTITLTANRIFQTTSIQNIIATAVANADNPSSLYTRSTTSTSYTTPGITSSFSGKDLLLSSSDTGTSAMISIQANGAALTDLGISSGLVTGSGGTGGNLTGSINISGGVAIGGTGVLRIQVVDGDFHTAPSSTSTDITFNRGVALSAASIVNEFNNYFVANGLDATAALGGGGELQLNSTQTGTDSSLRITSFGGAPLGSLGFFNGQTAVGSGGNFATITGNTNQLNYAEAGFELDGFISFRVGDQSGTLTETITFGKAGVSVLGETFTLAQSEIASILDNSGLKATGVDFGFDSEGHLNFFSGLPGYNNRITLIAEPVSRDLGLESFGIDFNQEARGTDRAEFSVFVTDSSLRFQIGANQRESLNLRIADSGADALGIRGLDLTSIDTAISAMDDIDEAIGRISSEQSRLGSLQNRMESTIDHLHRAHLGQSEVLSRIRDADIAKEQVDYLKSLIMNGTAMAQLAQVNGIKRQNLQLLI